METSTLTPAKILESRVAISLTTRRKLVRVAIIHGLFGLAAGLTIYFATPGTLGIAIFLGFACALLSGIPVVLELRERYARMVHELDILERDVLSGMVIYDTEFKIMARHAQYLPDDT